jgi:hypothetical protein
MAIKPVKTENLTILQNTYRKFWTKFNDISSSDDSFAREFKVHPIPSIRYYQDYSVGKPYNFCIKLNFKKELVAVQAYFGNMVAYDEFSTMHKERIEQMIGKHLVWERKGTKGYAQLTLSAPSPISDIANWDTVCSIMIENAILMKEVFEKF